MSKITPTIMCLIQFLDLHSGSITAIATIFLVGFTAFYVWLTRKLVKIQTQDIMQPMIGFNLTLEAQGSDFITRVYVTNNSKFFCQVWTNFNMKVYGEEHKHSHRYDGIEPWNVLPGGTIIGWFSVSEIFQKTDRNLQEIIADSKVDIDKKLTVDVEISAKGLPGGEINYPKLHWYLELSERRTCWVYMS